MGVTGLWNIVDSAGHPISLETLHNKVIAIDLSLWINQSIKGFRGRNGQTVENAHVLGLFHRICKLLFYRIKPVFVFDGDCPQLKRKTIHKRAEQRYKAINKTRETSMKVLKNFIASQLSNCDQQLANKDTDSLPLLESSLLPNSKSLKIYEELYDLEKNNLNSSSDESLSEDEPKIAHNYMNVQNLDSIDMNSKDFKSLPPNIRYEILTELKQKFKGYRNTDIMPNETNDFSSFQLKRLLKKRDLQSKIDETIRQLNGQHSEDVIKDWKDKDIYLGSEANVGRLMSDENTHYIFLKRSQTSSSQTITDNNQEMESNKITSVSMPSKDNISNDSSCLVISDSSDSEGLESDSIKNCEPIPKNIKQSNDYSKNSDILNEFVDQKPIEISDESEEEILTKDEIKSNESTFEINNIDSIASIIVSTETNNFTKIKEIDVDSDSNHNDFEEVWPQTPDSFDKFVVDINNEELQNLVANEESDEIVKEDESALKRFQSTNNKDIENTNEKTISNFKPDSVSPLKTQPNIESIASCSQSIPLERVTREEVIEMNKQNRMANQTTDQMMIDCQHLLKLFGIPFVVSPMEAEAQCAALEILGLTEGTITDDSDVLLFGAQTVYKNFFTSSKYVELFKASDIESKFGLTRSSLICIAMLTGSDYTDGVDGIGAVTATEILSEFPGDGLKPLIDYKNWLEDKQKTGDKRPENAIKAKLLKFRLNESFPNRVIFDAYMNPMVETSTEKFIWSMPRLDELRQYAIYRFGWTSTKTDQILVPLMKKVNEKQVQMTIDNYFRIQVQPKDTSTLSKRLNTAIDKLKGKEPTLPKNQQKYNKNLNALSEKVKNQRKRRQTKADKCKAKSKPNSKRKHLFKQIPQEINLSESSESDD